MVEFSTGYTIWDKIIILTVKGMNVLLLYVCILIFLSFNF